MSTSGWAVSAPSPSMSSATPTMEERLARLKMQKQRAKRRQATPKKERPSGGGLGATPTAAAPARTLWSVKWT